MDTVCVNNLCKLLTLRPYVFYFTIHFTSIHPWLRLEIQQLNSKVLHTKKSPLINVFLGQTKSSKEWWDSKTRLSSYRTTRQVLPQSWIWRLQVTDISLTSWFHFGGGLSTMVESWWDTRFDRALDSNESRIPSSDANYNQKNKQQSCVNERD